MSPARSSLGEQLAALAAPAPAFLDIDPEAAGLDAIDHNNNNGDVDGIDGLIAQEDDLIAAREHYLPVGRSAIRSSVAADALDAIPKYAGRAVSRQTALNPDLSASDHSDISSDNEDVQATSDEDEFGDQDSDQQDSDLENNSDDQESSAGDSSSSSAGDSDAEDRQEAMMSQLARLEQDEKKMMLSLSQSAQADIEKGRHVRSQLSLWDNLLDIRIHIQKVVDLVNRLPQPDTYPEIVPSADIDENNDQQTSSSIVHEPAAELASLLDDLVSTRLELITKSSTVKLDGKRIDAIVSCKRKRQETSADLLKTDPTAWLDSTWSDIVSPLDDTFTPFRDATIEKWSNKVQAAGGGGLPAQKKFKAINQSAVTQIKQVLQDRDRLVKRTQLRRSEYKVIGKTDAEVAAVPSSSDDALDIKDTDEHRDKHLDNYDPEIFDDADYYQQLLKELIESRMADTNDPILLGMRHAQLKALQTKRSKKKNVDTKASKGRKIRFHVHEKLQNYMASEPRGTWHDEMIDELFVGLFGRVARPQQQQQSDQQTSAGDKGSLEDVSGVVVDSSASNTMQITATGGFRIMA